VLPTVLGSKVERRSEDTINHRFVQTALAGNVCQMVQTGYALCIVACRRKHHKDLSKAIANLSIALVLRHFVPSNPGNFNPDGSQCHLTLRENTYCSRFDTQSPKRELQSQRSLLKLSCNRQASIAQLCLLSRIAAIISGASRIV
jgi:hypothetical protein